VKNGDDRGVGDGIAQQAATESRAAGCDGIAQQAATASRSSGYGKWIVRGG
jgi:hypothetical protein